MIQIRLNLQGKYWRVGRGTRLGEYTLVSGGRRKVKESTDVGGSAAFRTLQIPKRHKDGIGVPRMSDLQRPSMVVTYLTRR